MASRAYGQYCGFARALEVIGERWALLIVRDLLVSPRRFTDLHRGLPGIPTNVLTSRLKELEEGGVIRRRLLPRPSGVVYELTDYGAELQDVVLRLGMWGAKTMGDPRPEEIVTVDSMIMAFRTTFCPERTLGMSDTYELHMGDIVINLHIAEGKLVVRPGPLPGADLVIEAGPAIKELLSRQTTPAQALADGRVRIAGPTKLFKRFVSAFEIPKA